MNNDTASARTFARFFCAAIALSWQVSAFGACDAPEYRLGRKFADNSTDLAFTASIALEAFAPKRLVCLAEVLKREAPGRNVHVFLFSSNEAAIGYVPLESDVPPEIQEYKFKFHGSYEFNEQTHEESVHISPDGEHHDADVEVMTTIVLPVTGTPVCKLQIGGRCLLEFQHIYYPAAYGEAGPTGQVTLTATIRPDGTVWGLAVTDEKANPPAKRSFLADFAKKNLSTWRFEPGEKDEPVRITYRFEVSDIPVPGGQRVEFHLPSEVLVRNNRPH
jgi:hypothetical protein